MTMANLLPYASGLGERTI